MWVWKMQYLMVIVQNLVLVMLIAVTACPIGVWYLSMVWRKSIEEFDGDTYPIDDED
jgi:hypothetical protein